MYCLTKINSISHKKTKINNIKESTKDKIIEKWIVKKN